MKFRGDAVINKQEDTNKKLRNEVFKYLDYKINRFKMYKANLLKNRSEHILM